MWRAWFTDPDTHSACKISARASPHPNRSPAGGRGAQARRSMFAFPALPLSLSAFRVAAFPARLPRPRCCLPPSAGEGARRADGGRLAAARSRQQRFRREKRQERSRRLLGLQDICAGVPSPQPLSRRRERGSNARGAQAPRSMLAFHALPLSLSAFRVASFPARLPLRVAAFPRLRGRCPKGGWGPACNRRFPGGEKDAPCSSVTRKVKRRRHQQRHPTPHPHPSQRSRGSHSPSSILQSPPLRASAPQQAH
jgi:hypothetical protein